MSTAVQLQRRPTFQISEVKLKVWPLLATLAFIVVISFVSGGCEALALKFLDPEKVKAMPWMMLFPHHAGMLIAALICIVALSRGKVRDYGLRWPEGKTYIGAALGWGIAFGVLMTVVDRYQNLLSRTAPDVALTRQNAAGWLSFQGLWSGTVEEIAFRALLISFLMAHISGRVRLGNYDMHIAGVIVAVLFALMHATSFWTRPSMAAAGQQVYAFVLAILYAYWLEKSKSVVAPIIGHNLGNLVEYCLVFTMVWAMR
jgi:membrane protease YdiL (CAAX protease family)